MVLGTKLYLWTSFFTSGLWIFLVLCLVGRVTVCISMMHSALIPTSPLIVFSWLHDLMSCFVLVVRNQNKEKLIPIVLFNQRYLWGISWSFQDSLCHARLSPFQSNHINRLEVSNILIMTCLSVWLATVQWWPLHKGFYCNFQFQMCTHSRRQNFKNTELITTDEVSKYVLVSK